MGTDARTERGKFAFTVKEFADGTPWIMTEPLHKTMPILDEAFIGFDLPDGTTFEQARKVAAFMDENLAGISVTIFDTHPMFKTSRSVPTDTDPAENDQQDTEPTVSKYRLSARDVVRNAERRNSGQS
jgi:hypothetical protein